DKLILTVVFSNFHHKNECLLPVVNALGVAIGYLSEKNQLLLQHRSVASQEGRYECISISIFVICASGYKWQKKE
ncbi:MAG TPA: hypothetical protein PK855_07540, partial [Bacteroidales bacterium]|nr:hypothetical protein [Bacteroidales bacterium]